MRFNSSTVPSDSVRPPRASARSSSGSNLPLAFMRFPRIDSPVSGTSVTPERASEKIDSKSNPLEWSKSTDVGQPPSAVRSAENGGCPTFRSSRHGAIDVVVAGGGEVERDRRFLQGDHAAGRDVEAAADAVAVAAAGSGAGRPRQGSG